MVDEAMLINRQVRNSFGNNGALTPTLLTVSSANLETSLYAIMGNIIAAIQLS